MKNRLLTAITAALEAGDAINKIYETPFEVEIKKDNSPLTVADMAANTIINTYLVPTDIPIISEENKLTDYAQRKEWNECWIVDPLDGTKEFIKRNGEFTVNIAMVANGRPELGVIYAPYTKELYFAEVAAEKAYKVESVSGEKSVDWVMENAKEIRPRSVDDKIRVVGSRSHLNEDTKAYINDLNALKEKEIVSKGSSLKFCLIAEGKADVYPRFAPTMEWDTAAGQAICEAVGVHVLALPANSPMSYNKENLLNPWFLVTKEL